MSTHFQVVLAANEHNPIPEWVPIKLAEAGIDYVHHECYDREDLKEHAADADVIWLMSSRRLIVEENMDVLKKVGAVIKCGSGTDSIDHDACTKRGILVAHTPDDVTDPTSDHSIAMLFTAVRQTARQDRLVRRGRWDPLNALPLGKLTGADLGIIGFGRIGRAITRKLSGFRMCVRVYDPYVDAAVIEANAATKVSMDELLRRSQYVLVCCPLTKETRGMLADEELATMRADSVVVNCARAGVVDEQALIRALKRGQVRSAALDVLHNHPLLPNDELLALETVNFTPHMGGYLSDYPDAHFVGPVEAIIDISKMRMPAWIANEGVTPKWHMTLAKAEEPVPGEQSASRDEASLGVLA